MTSHSCCGILCPLEFSTLTGKIGCWPLGLCNMLLCHRALCVNLYMEELLRCCLFLLLCRIHVVDLQDKVQNRFPSVTTVTICICSKDTQLSLKAHTPFCLSRLGQVISWACSGKTRTISTHWQSYCMYST